MIKDFCPFHLNGDILMIDPKCPYNDKECPKIKEITSEIEVLKSDMKTISRYLYLIIGMIAVNWGITLW